MKKLLIFTLSLLLIFKTGVLFSQETEKVLVFLFWGHGCPHCEKEKKFLKKLEQKYSFVEVKNYEIWENKANQSFLESLSKDLNIKSISVPITIIQNKHTVMGFLDEDSTGKRIEKLILKEYYKIAKELPPPQDNLNAAASIPEIVSLPVIGEINIKELSLPLITIILGALDGFNPCAMWVLVMLLSFLIAIRDRKKLIILGGIFILASGFVYFLFMVAWLNLILFIGYMFIVKIIIGSIAILGGGYYLKEYFTNKDGSCRVTGSKQKAQIASKLSYYLENKGFWISALAIIVLAFLVNLIELICSAGIPAVYTQILAMTPLSSLAYYLYILLYIFVFLLESIIVFIIAVFSLKLTNVTAKISRYTHLIGGIVLLIIGILLIFKPEWLMLG